MASYSPGSSSFSSSPLSSPDNSIVSSVNENGLVADNVKDSSSSSSSSDDGFMSGEDEFEPASDRPIVAVPDEETEENLAAGDVSYSPFASSSEQLMAATVMPIARVSEDDDFEDEMGEVPDIGDLKEDDEGANESVDKGTEDVGGGDYGEDEVVVEMNESANSGESGHEKVELGENDLEAKKVVEEQKGAVPEEPVVVVETEEAREAVEKISMPGGGIEREDPAVGEPTELEDSKLTKGGDHVTESIQRVLVESTAVVVGDVAESKETEVKGFNVPAQKDVSLDNGFDHVNHDVEEHIDSSIVHDGNVEHVASNDVETPEVNPSGVKIDLVMKDNGSNANVVKTDSVAEGHDGEEMEAHVSVGSKEEKPMAEVVAEADYEAEFNGSKVEACVEVAAETVSSDKVDEEGGGATQLEENFAQSPGATVAGEQGHVENDRTFLTVKEEKLENEVLSKLDSNAVEKRSVTSTGEFGEADEEKPQVEGEGEIEGSSTDEETEGMIFGSSEAAKQFLEELEQGSGVGSHSGAESYHDQSHRLDGQIVTDSDEEADTDEEGEGKELFDSATLAALLKAATAAGSDGGSVTITSQDGSRLFSVDRPAGLGSPLQSVKPASRSVRPSIFAHSNLIPGGDSETNLSEAERKKLEMLQQLRVKFLRLVQRLGHSPEDSIAAQVLYRLALVAGRQTSQLFSLDSAKKEALQLEAEGKDDLNFSLNILVLGKTGVGKSATINSIFGEEKSLIHAFEPATSAVREVTGTVNGVKIRVIDTPGLKSSALEQGANRKILSSIKKFTKNFPPDIVLYVDRLDTQTRDLNDLPLLRSIASTLGSPIWRNAIVTLTHAASAPPDGPSGSPLSYEVFVAQRSHVVQQSIGQAVGDLRLMNPSLMNPVSLVENHPSCRKNRDGEKVLPNGQCWRPQLLLLCYSMKILSEASSLSKTQDPFDHRKLFGFRVRSPPLPYLLSWLLQSRTHPKLSADQGGENGDSDIELDEMSDSDQEDVEDEYDQLPPFKPLRKTQLSKLSKEQRKAYFEEYDYRVKLLQKKQWREELRRMREIKKKGKVALDEYGFTGEDMDQEDGAPAAVPVPLPDMVLPPSFDGDNPAYRYRFLEPTSQFLARPVLDTHGWDHDCGYDGINIEHSLSIASRFPAAVAVQVTKDKKEFSIHLDSSVAAKYGENGSNMAGFDIQNVGKQLAYIVRGETKFKNFKKNKTAAGVSVTFLGENVAAGVKVEDQIVLGKRLVLVGSTGTVRSQGDAAYGANLEVRLREADFPIGQDQSSLGLSLVKWRGDLALGANLQSQFSIGRNSKIAVRAGLNNKLSGQITVRTSSSDQLQIALLGILPVAMAIYKSIRPSVSENYSMY